MEPADDAPAPLNISRDFVSEKDVEQTRLAREQAFELAKRLNPNLARPVDSTDASSFKPLHMQLAQNKAAKQEEWEAQHALKNQIYSLKEEDIAFVESVRQQEEEAAKRDRALLDEFKSLVRTRLGAAQQQAQQKDQWDAAHLAEAQALAAAQAAAAVEAAKKRPPPKDVQKSILSSAVRVKTKDGNGGAAEPPAKTRRVDAKEETKEKDDKTREQGDKTKNKDEKLNNDAKEACKADTKASSDTTSAKVKSPVSLIGLAYGDSDDE